MLEQRFFDNTEALFNTLQQCCEDLLAQALQERQVASLLVSGGSSPQPLYNRLSHSELDWSRMQIALVDERWVSSEHEASNERFIRANLLQHRAAEAKFIGMKNKAPTPQQGRHESERAYQQLHKPFDLCILGMGLDGHTASWFPEAEGLEQALNQSPLCQAITARPSVVTGEYLQRMTLSRCALLQCRQIFLLISGEQKRQVYESARKQTDISAMPVAAILQQQQVPVTVFWSP